MKNLKERSFVSKKIMLIMNILKSFIVIATFALGVEGLNAISGGELYLASVKHLAQQATAQSSEVPVQPVLQVPEPTPVPVSSEVPVVLQPVIEEGPSNHDFVDPQEVKNVLREIKDLKVQVKTSVAMLKKTTKGQNDIQKLSEISAELDRIKLALSNPNADSTDLRANIQEFYDARFWDEINSIRFKYEFPRQVKDMSKTLKRLEKIVATKSVKNLGFDLGRVNASIAEMQNTLQNAQNYFDKDEFEEAMEEMQNLHENNSPWDIESTIFRIRDIKKMLKRVKDQTIRAEIDGVLQEVIDAFNNGEYRDARETLDEYSDDLMQLLQKLIRSNFKKADNDAFSRIQNLEQLIIRKLQEADNTGGNIPEVERQ